MENNRIKPVDVANEHSTSVLDYSMSVIISRALPDVRDGLKPSQRRILYAMKELNLSPGGKTRKCSKIVGDTMGNYHPHGDAAIYGTLVNMAQDWSMRDILVIGQGNFGTPDGDPPAAARYTEAKLSGMGVALMPPMLIEAELASGDLVVACSQPMQGERAYYLVTPAQAHSPVLRAFAQWLAEMAGSE